MRRRKLPPPAGSSVYELTDWGRELKPIVLSLGTWAVRSPSFPERRPRGHRLRRPRARDVLRRRAAGGLSARYELRLDDSTFNVHIAGGAIELDRGPAEDPDAIVETDAATFSAVVWNGRDARRRAARRRRSRSRATGDAVDRLLGLFPKPGPAGSGA